MITLWTTALSPLMTCVFYSPSPLLVKILRCGAGATIPNLQMKRSREFLASKSTQWKSWETVRHRCGQWERLAQRQQKAGRCSQIQRKRKTDSGLVKSLCIFAMVASNHRMLAPKLEFRNNPLQSWRTLGMSAAILVTRIHGRRCWSITAVFFDEPSCSLKALSIQCVSDCWLIGVGTRDETRLPSLF